MSDEIKFRYGQIVTVTDYQGTKLTRRVVQDSGEVVVICNEEEYQLAAKELRRPAGIGFRKRSVTE